jgi:hypothetical protein
MSTHATRRTTRSDEELAWLGERFAVLQTLVETVCQERLDSQLINL